VAWEQQEYLKICGRKSETGNQKLRNWPDADQGIVKSPGAKKSGERWVWKLGVVGKGLAMLCYLLLGFVAFCLLRIAYCLLFFPRPCSSDS
jgi:hypothetical protein